jgi:hypothetical protein
VRRGRLSSRNRWRWRHPRLDHAVIGVHDAALIAQVRHVTAKHRGDTEPFLDLAQDENAAIRGELAECDENLCATTPLRGPLSPC